MTKQTPELLFRRPRVEEGLQMWKLVRTCGTLDVNSTYAYLLVCKHFAETCGVAEFKGEVVGMMTGYHPPGKSNTLFVWQIGVADSMRKSGIAKRLLLEVLQRESCREVSFVEATVRPSNKASRALFQSLARELSAEVAEEICFEQKLFPQGDREAEYLLRLGPLYLGDL